METRVSTPDNTRLARLSDVILRLQRMDPGTLVAHGTDADHWMLMVVLDGRKTAPLTEDVASEAVNLGEAVKKRRSAR